MPTLMVARSLRSSQSKRSSTMTTLLAEPRKSTPSSVADDPRWARIVARDKTADGYLWYSVVTTGVYCRPSCPSRTANPRNVQLHDSLECARATGFRPCKRCNPEGLSTDAENTALVAKVCRMIEESEEEPSLEGLAEAVGRSPSYFHRIFKATTGVTPKEYATAHRAAKVRHGLTSGSTVTEAIYDAGFNSSGRFYEKSTDMLGMTPSHYRAGLPASGTAGKIPHPANGCCPARSSSPVPPPGWSPITTACRCCSRRRISTGGSTGRSARRCSSRPPRKPCANGRCHRGLIGPASATTIRQLLNHRTEAKVPASFLGDGSRRPYLLSPSCR
jgi:methylphosphotriester-DNA--protein-cysteine methyltransferase